MLQLLTRTFNYCQLQKEDFKNLSFTNTLLSLRFQTGGIDCCKEKIAKHKNFLSVFTASSEVRTEKMFYIFQADYLKISPLNRVNTETICLAPPFI